mgnify:CR=1 FL=1
MLTFTVFTPTYNRAHTLGRVYESLRAQTFKDFEWVIVDDGSTDGTPDLVAGWKDLAEFPIRYFRKPNQGKHTAFNQGVREARGRLFLSLDSDDSCHPQALERFWHHWQSIPTDARPGFAALTALCEDESGKIVGQLYPSDIFDSDSSEIKHRYKVEGEKWGFIRTDILRQFPYPEPPGVTYVPESVVWIPIAARYKTRFVNEPLRIYHSTAGNQYTGSGLKRSHLEGLALWHQVVLNYEAKWFWHDPLDLLRSTLHYVRFSFLCGKGIAWQWRRLHSPGARILWLLGLGPGALKARLDHKQVHD